MLLYNNIITSCDRHRSSLDLKLLHSDPKLLLYFGDTFMGPLSAIEVGLSIST